MERAMTKISDFRADRQTISRDFAIAVFCSDEISRTKWTMMTMTNRSQRRMEA
jgi:hypothetical protein